VRDGGDECLNGFTALRVEGVELRFCAFCGCIVANSVGVENGGTAVSSGVHRHAVLAVARRGVPRVITAVAAVAATAAAVAANVRQHSSGAATDAKPLRPVGVPPVAASGAAFIWASFSLLRLRRRR